MPDEQRPLGVDAEFILAIQNGDLDAFEALFNKYKGLIFRTALAITHDSGTAEEVLQDCFLKAYTNIERINPEVPISPWLHRVAVNLSCNALKKRRWLEPLENIAERLFSDNGGSPEGAAEMGELSGMLRQMIDRLPIKHRVVVVLHYLQEFSLPEIAYIIDCPVGTVKSRLHYARQVLRAGLEKEYGQGAPAAAAGLGLEVVLWFPTLRTNRVAVSSATKRWRWLCSGWCVSNSAAPNRPPRRGRSYAAA